MKTKQWFACLSLALVAFSAQAFERPFPQNAKRGTLSLEDYPTVAIDGKVRRLSVGAWIKNTNNTIDMPASLAGREYLVNYTENGQGEINRVWILSPEEARKPAPNRQQNGQQGEQQNNQRMLLIQ